MFFTTRCFLASVVLAGLGSAWIRAADQDPDELIQTRTAYRRDIEFASRPIRERYLSKLDSLKRSLGTKGDARAAAAVQDEIDRVMASAMDPRAVARFAGVWFLEYKPVGTRRYVIMPDGRVTHEENNGAPVSPPRETKIVMNGQDFLIDFGDGAVERLSMRGNRLVSELFSPKTLYPKGRPNFQATGKLLR
jgi:hypothetical protein